MKGYFECGKCKHQWMMEGSSMNNVCPECGLSGCRCAIGGMTKPEWYQGSAKRSKPKSLIGRLAAALLGKEGE